MRRLYLLLALIGLFVPYYFFVTFLLAHGFAPGVFVRQLLSSPAATFFAADLLLTAVVFLAVSHTEARRCKMKHWWIYPMATLFVGPSFSMPLFLYYRERHFAPSTTDTIDMGIRIKVR
jgi:hypothetical protein